MLVLKLKVLVNSNFVENLNIAIRYKQGVYSKLFGYGIYDKIQSVVGNNLIHLKDFNYKFWVCNSIQYWIELASLIYINIALYFTKPFSETVIAIEM